MNKIKVLITGGSGFIGTNLMNYFLESGYDLLNIDKVRPKLDSHSTAWKNCDINHFEPFRNIILNYQPDYIIHLAAKTDLDGRIIEDYTTNTLGVKNLMLIIKELSCLKKIIITSSMLVCKGGYQPLNQVDYKPNTIYGESKVITEKIVWDNLPNCDWAIIRPTSIWGPWFSVPYRNFFEMIISKKYFHIGDEACTKTYGYVGNSVFQIKKILMTDTSEKSNKIFYIGDNPPTNIEDWADEISKELGLKIIKLPYVIIKGFSYFGDFLKSIKINFPITSFRLKNMTTNNIVNLTNTYQIAKNPIYSRNEGVKKTLQWMSKFKKVHK